VLVLCLAITSTFEQLAVLANLSLLVLYGTCCLATWQLRRLDVRAGGTPFTVPAPGLVVLLACLMIVWMLTSARPVEWMTFAISLAVATVIFVFRRKPDRL
jgi:amino acid transporter